MRRRHLLSPLLASIAIASLLAGCDKDDDDDDDDDDDVDAGTSEQIGCAEPTGTPIEMEVAKLYIEFQSTDDDTGIHGLFGGVDWAEMCITAPGGAEFLVAKPRGNLEGFGLSDLFFESVEPAADEISQADVLAMFPAGDWEVTGTDIDGVSFEGTAELTHDIPLPPNITAPADGVTVDPSNVVVTWDPVTQSVAGDPVTISGYEVIVTNEDKDGEDEHGQSQPIMSTHVVPAVNSLTIPVEFFEAGTTYELEVIAIEESGNQTITVFFFDTP